MDMYQTLRTTNAYRNKAASWMRVGDRINKGFLEVIKCKGSGSQPTCLKKTNGTMEEEQIDQDALKNI